MAEVTKAKKGKEKGKTGGKRFNWRELEKLRKDNGYIKVVRLRSKEGKGFEYHITPMKKEGKQEETVIQTTFDGAKRVARELATNLKLAFSVEKDYEQKD